MPETDRRCSRTRGRAPGDPFLCVRQSCPARTRRSICSRPEIPLACPVVPHPRFPVVVLRSAWRLLALRSLSLAARIMSSEPWCPLESLSSVQAACRRQGADVSLLAFTRIANTALTGHRPVHMIPAVTTNPACTHAAKSGSPPIRSTLLRYEDGRILWKCKYIQVKGCSRDQPPVVEPSACCAKRHISAARPFCRR